MIKKIKVLVVDDSLVIRRAITNLLTEDPDIEVVGHAVNGQAALVKITELNPDVMTLDVEMPVMDGLETLRHLKKQGTNLPVIMCSTLTERGAMATLDALSLGASCYVTKPHTSGSVEDSIDALRRDLLPKVKALGSHFRVVQKPVRKPQTAAPETPSQNRPRIVAPPQEPAPDKTKPVAKAPPAPNFLTPATAAAPKRQAGVQEASPASKPLPAGRPLPANVYVPEPRKGPPSRVDLVVIGVSTGGPNALATLIPALPKDLPVPVLIVQHMPPVFTKLVAERLNLQSALSVREATDGELIAPGSVLIAPGDFHLILEHKGDKHFTRLTQTPPENFCRPAVDVLFRSAVQCFGPGMLGVVLTGMGSDGALGCEAIRRAGGQVIVQDSETSVVWGMPGSVAERGLAEAILPIQEIAKDIVRRVAQQRKP